MSKKTKHSNAAIIDFKAYTFFTQSIGMSVEDIIVMGNVATGKSHIAKVLKHNLLNVVMYPEFIHNDTFAMEMLARRFKNRVSALTFQNFILDKWKLFYEKNKDKEGIRLYERLPDDAVKIFAKMSLTPNEYAIQTERLTELNKLLPSYDDMHNENCTWIRYENNFTKDLTPLISAVKDAGTKFVVVEVRSKTAFDNYKYRDRKEEFYTEYEISELQKVYNTFADEHIRRIGCNVYEM